MDQQVEGSGMGLNNFKYEALTVLKFSLKFP